MSVSVKIVSDILPDVQEPIVSIGISPCGLRGAYKLLIGHYPEHDDRYDVEERIGSYQDIINEIDLGNGGVFNDDLFWRRWNKESEKESRTIEYMADRMKISHKEYYGLLMRSRLRQDAVRFFLYLKAGYEIIWES